MKNELKIKPLLRYEVTIPGLDDMEVFTADDHQTDGNSFVFFRTGNVIREYHGVGGIKIVITPVEET